MCFQRITINGKTDGPLKMSNFTDACAKLQSGFCLVLQKCSSTTAFELQFVCVMLPFNTRLVGFLCFCGFKAGLILFLLWFSLPFGLIAEARWGGRVRNNLFTLRSYFQHSDGAMNSDMNLAILQRLWFCLNSSYWTAVGGHENGVIWEL